MRKIRIGTRSSRLALWQAQFVAEELKKFSPALEVELVKVHTTGDKIFLRAGNAGTFHRGGC